jgi:hypothetical protein
MTEFDRQVAALELPGVLAEPLREAAALAEAGAPGRIPFLLVAPGPRLDALARIAGATSMLDTDDLTRWAPIDGVRVPASAAYLAIDVDVGDATRGVTPDDAMATLAAEERSPLTLDEGIALVTHHPQVIARNHGVQFPGSRCGDRRVTAIWLSGTERKLGWCWAGNPHGWLGMASCAARWGAA